MNVSASYPTQPTLSTFYVQSPGLEHLRGRGRMGGMTLPRRLGEGEYYHVFNRGAHRHLIGKDKADWQRLLFYVLFFQPPRHFKYVARLVSHYSPLSGYPISESDLLAVVKDREVEVVCFALMPNHFHLLLREKSAGGISAYLQRVATAYTM